MLIPEFWAEGRAQHRERGKQVTVRRFGWSETSHDQAQAMADTRAGLALAALLAGQKLEKFEPRVAYNGAEGVPIREQVLERHGTAVISRNVYGAQCLNTPDVLFADIDFSEEPEPQFIVVSTLLLILASGAAGYWLSGWGLALLFGFLALLAGYGVSRFLQAMRVRAQGGPEQQARTRLSRFMEGHPDWRLRLYRTPAGFRLLALHRRFEPGSPEVEEFFAAIGVDKLYARMCRNQRCFRARLTAKPWRIGISDHVKPRPGVWPINPERLPERERWIADYERRAAGFAACHFVEDLGQGPLDRDADAIRELHDIRCRALGDLPLA